MNKKGYVKGDNHIKDAVCMRCNNLIKPFNPSRRKEKKYCSNYCKYNKADLVTNKECEVCGKVLKPFHSHRERKYCSHKCQLNRDGKIEEKWVDISCANCNKSFTAQLWDVENSGTRFCSRTCLYEYRTDNDCKICGNKIELNRANSQRLCRKCYTAQGTLRHVLTAKGYSNTTKFLNRNKELVLTYRIYQDKKKERYELTSNPKRNQITSTE